VVATYVARAYGVHSGMPMQHAFRKCPDAVFLPNDHPAYDAASAGVMEVMRSFGHPVGVWDWDEAYLGAGCDDPEELARAVRTAVHDHTALTGAVGIGDTMNRPICPPGVGKTMLGERVPGLLPDLDIRDSSKYPLCTRWLGSTSASVASIVGGASEWPRRVPSRAATKACSFSTTPLNPNPSDVSVGRTQATQPSRAGLAACHHARATPMSLPAFGV
jgi:hypothetical protein